VKNITTMYSVGIYVRGFGTMRLFFRNVPTASDVLAILEAKRFWNIDEVDRETIRLRVRHGQYPCDPEPLMEN
jgi:hypothetical protein